MVQAIGGNVISAQVYAIIRIIKNTVTRRSDRVAINQRLFNIELARRAAEADFQTAERYSSVRVCALSAADEAIHALFAADREVTDLDRALLRSAIGMWRVD